MLCTYTCTASFTGGHVQAGMFGVAQLDNTATVSFYFSFSPNLHLSIRKLNYHIKKNNNKTTNSVIHS